MNSNVALSIVVPIYNEEESLPFLVNQLLEVLQPMEETFELVLVNDGSSDNSAEVIRKLSFDYNAKTYFRICKFGSSSPQSILFINNKKYE